MNAQHQPITDADAVIAELPDLRIEVAHTEDMVILEQHDTAGQVDRLAIHKWQVLLLARHFGLLGKGAGPGPLAAELGRRLHVLHGRIDHLSHWLHNLSDSEHADLDYEKTYSLATCEIADTFIADVERPAGNAPKNGGVQPHNTPKFPVNTTKNGGASAASQEPQA